MVALAHVLAKRGLASPSSQSIRRADIWQTDIAKRLTIQKVCKIELRRNDPYKFKIDVALNCCGRVPPMTSAFELQFVGSCVLTNYLLFFHTDHSALGICEYLYKRKDCCFQVQFKK